MKIRTMRAHYWTPASVDRTAASLALAALLAVTSACVPARSADTEPSRRLIYLDEGGKLVYVPDEKGNVIPDFSNAGYGGGGAPIPHVPVKSVVEPGPGDDAERIQAAIDRVSRMKPDANGHRGAVLLRKGEYQIAGTLRISVGGVVLRGEGRERDGTVIMAAGTGRRTLIEINAVLWRLEEHRSVRVSRAKAWREVPGTRRAITDAYVPVGARTFHVESTRGLAAGDRIIVHRPNTSPWISAIGMDRIPPRPGRVTRQWQAGQYDLRFDRVITRIRDTEVTIDAPLVNAIEQEFGGGWIYEYTFPERIAQVGVENLRAESHFNGRPDDEDHAWNFILLDTVENAWVRNVTGVHFAYSCVYVERHGKWITLEDAACLDPVSKIASPRRYPFALRGQLTLVRRAVSNDGRHDFVMHSRVPGPNVFLDCRSRNAHNDSGPHHRWATGTLYDNVHVRGDALNVRDRGNMGTGHGWAGARMMFWNFSADSIICEKPPTAQNWAIGSSAGNYSGDCYWYSAGNRWRRGVCISDSWRSGWEGDGELPVGLVALARQSNTHVLDQFAQIARAKSRILVKRHGTRRLILFLKQHLDPANRFRPQQHVPAHRTDLSRNVVDDNHLTTVPYRVHDFARSLLSRTSTNAALHIDCLLCVGVIHLGNLGS